jgi:hypothetical protein
VRSLFRFNRRWRTNATDLRSVDFSFFERLEEINFGELAAGLAGLIESKARAAGVIVTDDY